MRFYPAHRPAAKKILEKLEILTDPNDVTEMMLIAVSGAGKTSTIFQVARDVFTIYIPCTPGAVYQQETRHARDKSGSFVFLENAVNRTVPGKKSSEEKTAEAKRLSIVFFVANLFSLFLFLKKFPSASPIQFLLFQLTKSEGRDVVEKIFTRLESLTLTAIQDVARGLRRELLPLVKGILPTFCLH